MGIASIHPTHAPAAKAFEYFDRSHTFGKSVGATNAQAPQFLSVVPEHAQGPIFKDPARAHVAQVLHSPVLPHMPPEVRKTVQSINPHLVGSVVGLHQGLNDFFAPDSSIGPIRSFFYGDGILAKNYAQTWDGKAERARDISAAATGMLPYAAATYFGGVHTALIMGYLGDIVDKYLPRLPGGTAPTQP